jgi:acyl-CoA hydrolase
MAENPVTGDCTYTNTGYLVYVALDETGHPIPVPPLIAETAEQRSRMEAGRLRQEYRLSHASPSSGDVTGK